MRAISWSCRLSVIAAALVVAACTAPAPPPPAQPAAPQPTAAAPGPTVPVSLNAEMVAFVDHAGHALWDVEKEGRAPKTDDDWAIVGEHATQLASAGALIQLPGTGTNDRTWTQSAGWSKWARALSDAGLAAFKASESKNLEALVTANGQLVDACEGCHKEFKPSLPSEGLTHAHAH